MHTTPARSRRGLARASTAVLVAAALPISTLVLAQTASAATPMFPDNVVVFPDRDFVSVEGYERYAGQDALVEVTRGGVPMGSARVPVSGTDVAFEINHPGGFCWGTGNGLDVTPDIRAGDVVSVTFPDGETEETVTSSATVTGDMAQNGTTIAIQGSYGPEVNPDFMEQRVINPDLVDLIGKRDIRALPGPIVPAARGGYSSGLAVTPDPAGGGSFVATYEFDTQEAADTAAAADLGERAMNWQVQDADGNRQGLTIAEFGELGGPGMGGCPAGPASQEPPAGRASATFAADKASVLVKWNPVVAQPGAAAVTGYSVEAIDKTPEPNGNSLLTGTRTNDTKTQATLALDPTRDYAVEVRAMTGAKVGTPFAMSGPLDQNPAQVAFAPQPNGSSRLDDPTTPPVQTDAVTVTSNGQVFFTTDGSPVVTGNEPSDTASFLVLDGNGVGSIPITGPSVLKVVAFDAASNITGPFEGTFAPGPAPAAPVAPTGLSSPRHGQDTVDLTWVDAGDASITGYRVTVYDAAGVPLADQPTITSVRDKTVRNLTPDTAYRFDVRAINDGGASDPSAPITVRTDAATDGVTISSARFRAGKDFRIVGTGNQVGVTIEIHRVAADGSVGALIPGAVGPVVAAAPPGIGDWDIRLRNGAVPTNAPAQIYAKSTGGGVAGPFTVTIL